MDKINLGATIPAYPMPVSLVGAQVEGRPNFLAVAWFSMASYKPPRLVIALGKGHYTNPGIKANKAFSLCLPSEDLVGLTDYCGLVSGKKTDKMKPLILSQPDMNYWRLGEPVARAWHVGKQFREKR